MVQKQPMNPQSELDHLLIVSLEKLSQVFRSLLWDNAKQMNLSPIQIQFLIYIHSHLKKFSSVSEIARVFNLTAPTVSDAVKSLESKGMIQKIVSRRDRRRYPIALTRKGREVARNLSTWYEPLLKHLPNATAEKRESVLLFLLEFMDSLKHEKLLSDINPCISCVFFSVEKSENGSDEFSCTFRKVSLNGGQLQLNCPNYKPVKSD